MAQATLTRLGFTAAMIFQKCFSYLLGRRKSVIFLTHCNPKLNYEDFQLQIRRHMTYYQFFVKKEGEHHIVYRNKLIPINTHDSSKSMTLMATSFFNSLSNLQEQKQEQDSINQSRCSTKERQQSLN